MKPRETEICRGRFRAIERSRRVKETPRAKKTHSDRWIERESRKERKERERERGGERGKERERERVREREQKRKKEERESD